MNVKSILQSPPSTLLTSRLEAEVLLAHVLNISRSTLFARSESEVTPSELEKYLSLVKRRLAGEPIAYLTGFKEFWSLSFVVTPAVLIPRPETEHLVEEVLAKFSSNIEDIEVLELGTGSGAIAVALAIERPNWKIVAVDRSEEALEIAKMNANRLTTTPIKFHLSDWFSYFSKHPRQFNVIVSNPPYIAPDDIHLQQPDLRYEPEGALVSKPEALHEIRQIVSQAPYYFLSKGCLMLEHGRDQGHAVQDLMRSNGFMDIQTIRDLSDNDRVTIGYRP
jgi:release factor glutamine methyltransferase